MKPLPEPYWLDRPVRVAIFIKDWLCLLLIWGWPIAVIALAVMANTGK